MKTCTKCGENKPKTAFGKSNRTRDGLTHVCRSCRSEYLAQQHATDPSKANKRTAKWAAANQEKVKAKNAAWHAANREKQNARSTKWQVDNRYKASENAAKWAAENPERGKSAKAAFFAAHPDAIRIHHQNRRARKLKNGGVLSKGLGDRLFKLQRGKCACCKQQLGDNYHMDHIMPLALDGPNTDKNMQLLCPPCNHHKHAKHPIDFMQERGFLL